VYRAYQPSLDRRVAVKILRPHHLADPELRRRFVREARILAGLSHPNIIHVIDAGTQNGWAYYAMEYVEGTDFKKILREDEMPLPGMLDIIGQVLKGLEYAHTNGVIHRDIKPANIMVDANGNARLADFGIAHLFEAGDGEATKTGELMGTPAYMAPEQRASATNVDARSDIFSVGVLLYETITGRKPVGHVRPPSELNPDAPRALDAMVLKCLEHNPDDRVQTVAALRGQLVDIVTRMSGGAMLSEPAFPAVDNFVGRCKFLSTIKETPTSVVYLVENIGDHRLYAIKKITGREVELGYLRRLAVLRHPHILTVYGAGSDLLKTVVVTDHARGGALADRLARSWREEEITRFLYEAASALDFAHKNDIVHGNLKPSNILFDERGKTLLADFGLPSVSGKRRPWWRAPENQVSREADMFSLGAIAYHMLYGDRPRWLTEDQLHFPKSQHPVSRETRKLLTRLLEQNPRNRCISAEEVVLLVRPPAAKEAPSLPAGAEKSTRLIPLWLWMAVSVLALAAGTLFALWQAR
jgi:serine/threonine-protein kinase